MKLLRGDLTFELPPFDHDPTVRSLGLEEVLGIGRSGSGYRRHLTWPDVKSMAVAKINFPLILFSRG